MRLRAPQLVAAFLGMVLVAAAPAAWAATISLNDGIKLLNPSFEGTTNASGCPTSWVCVPASGSIAVVTPPAPPDGTHAAQFTSVNNIPSSVSLYQLSNQVIVANNTTTYTLEFWIGNPTGLN